MTDKVYGDFVFKWEAVPRCNGKVYHRTVAYYKGERLDVSPGVTELLEEICKTPVAKGNSNVQANYASVLRHLFKERNMPFRLKTIPSKYCLEPLDENNEQAKSDVQTPQGKSQVL